jgi:hypothetical protein
MSDKRNFNAEVKFQVRGKMTFSDIVDLISQKGISIIQEENLLSEIVFARLTDSELRSLKLSPKDEEILKCIMIQSRVHELKHAKGQKAKLEMPSNPITNRLPLSKFTLKVLKKCDKLNPCALYLNTDIEEMQKIFDKYPTVAQDDRKNIFSGMALARYARKYTQLSRNQEF